MDSAKPVIAINSTPLRPSSPRKSLFVTGGAAGSPARTRLFSTDISASKPLITLDGKVEEASVSKYVSEAARSLVASSVFNRKHVTTVKSFDRKDLHVLFRVAQEMRTVVEKQGQINLLAGKVMCSAFWEPSTRTSCSFESAMTRLGGGVVSINQITSSIAKGESLGDTGNSFHS